MLRHFSINEENRFRIIIDVKNVTEAEKIASDSYYSDIMLASTDLSSLLNNNAKDNKEDKYNIRKVNNVNIVEPNLQSKYQEKSDKIQYKNKQKTIIIDAGHGGIDPGARSYNGISEKHITLGYSISLRSILRKKGYNVILTRDNDSYITLIDRRSIGKKHNADLFLSIHADSSPNKKTRGLSVYTLSDNASDDVAHKLARSHNDYGNIVDGLSFSKIKSPDTKEALIGLSQRDVMNKSSVFASILTKNMKKNNLELVGNSHRFAGFAVLKVPDMPSSLIELGFLSNKQDVKNLMSKWYKEKMISVISKSIDEYFQESNKK
jgi:N-acetylmuramoyl-L-alanine amidase